MIANKQPDTPVNTTKKKPNKFKIIVIGLTIAIASLLVILCLLVATEPGTRWLLHTVLNKVENVSVGEINGTLVNELSLKQLHYKESNEFAVSIADFKLQWQISDLLNGHCHISKLYVNGVDIKGQPTGSEENKTNNEVPNIPLNISIDELAVNQFNWINGESKTEINKLTVSAALEQNNLTISSLLLDMPELQVTARSTLKVQSDWPLTAEINWSYLLNKSAVNGHLAVNGDMDRFDLVSQIKGAIKSSQTGFIRLSGDQPEFTLQGQWQKLQWPFTGKSQARSQQGDFQIQGTTEQYQAQLNATVSAMNQPDFSITLKGDGNQQLFNIKQLLLKPTQGQANLSGQLSWEQTIAFNLSLAAKQLNPADFGSNIPGKLDLKAQSKGKVIDGDINVELNIKQLAGVLHDQPLKANGKVTITNQKLNIDRLNVFAGSNFLETKGWLSEKSANLDLKINAPDLSTVWPSLAGSLNGNTIIKGSLKKPVLKSNLKGNNLRFANNRISKVYLTADYTHASKKQSKLDFSANTIQLAENKIDHISLQALGNQSDHNAQLELVSPLANLNIKTTGKWDGQKWLGHITQLNIDHPQLQKWQLQSTTSLTLSQSKEGLLVDMPNSCLTQNKSRLCIMAKGSSDTEINGQLSLPAWPLAATKIWLPDELNLTGNVSAQAQFSYGVKDTTAQINATISKGQALLQDDNFVHKIPFSTSTLQLQYQHDELDSQIHLDLGQQDHITADIKADKANSAGVRQLSGSIKSNIANMALLDGLLAEINKLQGQFIADLQLSGNSEKPVIIGSAQFQKGQFDMTKLGTTFRNIQLTLNSTTDNPEHLQINAEVESGKGKLSAQGQLNLLAKHNYPLQVKITGNNFQISRLPEAEVLISPALTINKHDNLTKIDGLIKIDRAKIEIETVPENAVVPSEDEVIITTDESQKKTTGSSLLNTRIGIEFGDNTHFSGFGLETRLTGKLQYTEKDSKQRLQGQAEMRDATYRSYGQDLTIRKGEFVFTGSTDNPWLNIEAIRKASKDDVTAILAVTGLLKSPETRIHTEPALPESEALAYLVTGKSLKGMSQSEGNAVANAAFSYGVGQLSWISDQLGIDEFEFEQSDKIEDSAVRLGQYLNPDLYVGVTIGLFSNKYAANLKYKLTDHFSIDTRAGESQRIDIKYHLESD